MSSRMSASGVRRGKAALFQWVQVPPGHRFSAAATAVVMEVTKWLKPLDIIAADERLRGLWRVEGSSCDQVTGAEFVFEEAVATSS